MAFVRPLPGKPARRRASRHRKALIRLVRKLTALRSAGPQFTSGDHFFYNDPQYVNRGIMLFRRSLAGGAFSLVGLNFTGTDVTGVSFAFPKSGTFNEQIEGKDNHVGVVAGVPVNLAIPSNYGCIWTG